MYSFLISLALLVIGYFTYGKYVANVFGPNSDRPTPCYTKGDGIDFLPMPTWKVFMIQFLNIAGVGPIFGAIMGSQFGTVSYLWIVFGTIFAGATHDYLAAMISLRQNGASLPDTIGKYLGKFNKRVMTVFIMVLLILVGAVFTSSPASIFSQLSADIIPASYNLYFWIVLIFSYYIIATLLPIDKVIGKIYPFFAFCLIFMAVGICGYILIAQPELKEWWDEGAFINEEWMETGNLSHVFPMMFISIACGAISGFHATQSPMMVRCLKDEKLGRPCFYGAMVTEGIVALIWAAAATVFFGENGLINEMTGKGYDGGSVATFISQNWLGALGGIFALLGIAFAPISSGDTALRSARLIISDTLNLKQSSIKNRLMISIPIFILSAAILIWSMTDKNGFGILWRYFGWSNQALSVFTLWAITVYLGIHKKNYWVTLIPANFMTIVTTSFICVLNPGGFGFPYMISLIIGFANAALITSVFFYAKIKFFEGKFRETFEPDVELKHFNKHNPQF
ncbi:MAG: carbon starvation protein A [Bacteroidales bacterium]|nr:carbon starvation protein A [Bacteroidales bacterium]